MEIKITKRKMLWHQCNDMCCNWYYDIYGRIISDDGKRYKKFNFVVSYDYMDIAEWAEPDSNEWTAITKAMHREYLEELIFSFTDYINSFDDCKDFYELCKNSITHWNDVVGRCA